MAPLTHKHQSTHLWT